MSVTRKNGKMTSPKLKLDLSFVVLCKFQDITHDGKKNLKAPLATARDVTNHLCQGDTVNL